MTDKCDKWDFSHGPVSPNIAVENVRLRAEVERLTREMDQWQARAESAWKMIDEKGAENIVAFFSGLYEMKALRARAENAERQVETLRAALRPFAELHATRYMTDGCRYEFRVDVAWIRNAVAALAETEKKDD